MKKAGRSCFVYYNIRRKIFSVRNLRNGLVREYIEKGCVYNCLFEVSQSGRARVLREQTKNIHAGILCDTWIMNDPRMKSLEAVQVTYNPYKYDTFVTVPDLRPIKGAQYVMLDSKADVKMIAYGPIY
jgi:hypothetical protein